ncbi:MAG: FHA domain-containing protein [Planctomycetota bacterium]|jgi:pSer/pThr/pTyr-binding forkhead associated (FHA) protein
MSMRLVMMTSDDPPRVFPLHPPRTVIGRSSRCDIRIALPSVADRQCELVVRDGVVRVRGLATRGGILHNGQPVSEADLAPDDVLTVGPVAFTLEAGVAEPSPEPITDAPPMIKTRPTGLLDAGAPGRVTDPAEPGAAP